MASMEQMVAQMTAVQMQLDASAEQVRVLSAAHDTLRGESSNAIMELRRLLAEEQQRAKFSGTGPNSKDKDVQFMNVKVFEGGKYT